MKKFFLSVCLFVSCHFARAQWTTSAPNIYYNTGNVGIGVTSPGFNLDMASALNSYIQLRMTNTTAGSTAGAGIQMTSQNGSSYLLRTSNVNSYSFLSNTTILQDAGGGDIVMYGGSEIARFTNGGNVCIGTTTGVEKLTIAGNALADKFRLNNVSTPGSGCGIFAPAAATVAVYSSSLERMRVAANGNVGIGTTNPAYPLQVNGTGDVLAVSGNGTNRNGIYVQSTNATAQSTVYADNDRGSFASYCGFLSGGSTNSLGTLFGLTRVDRGFMIADGASSQGLGVGTLTAQPLVLGTNNAERLRVLANGNVLIGKTSQTNTGYVFDVNGNARATSIVVNTTGADYVFGNDYSLPSLKKIEKYINEHHHLPDIAPAEEMQKKGLNLGDNQVRMLAKIEELTLYMIEQSKQQEKLTEEVKALQEQNRQLQRRLGKKRLHR